jgi:hypothetical protein
VSTSDEEAVNQIAESVSKGECILFLGAGVHHPPPEASPYQYPPAERPPLGNQLSQDLAEESRFSEQFPKESASNLQRVSLYFETKFSRGRLVKAIKEAVFVGKKPSPVLHGLADLKFPLVITTNYDQLFERSLEAANKHPHVFVYSKEEYTRTDDFQEFSAEEPFVFKIHGDIDRPESIVLTDEDYIQFILRMTDKDPFYPVPETFLYHFKKWPTLFIGYSLMDYNLRLLFKTLRWRIDRARIPDAYSVDLLPDPLIVDVWANQRKYVKFIAQDVWNFVPSLYRLIMKKDMPP